MSTHRYTQCVHTTQDAVYIYVLVDHPTVHHYLDIDIFESRKEDNRMVVGPDLHCINVIKVFERQSLT